ncbi:MAG: hypothetical protein LBG93_03045 [Treponema sp.]|nr:hypothetical protein [Treponema sp.]
MKPTNTREMKAVKIILPIIIYTVFLILLWIDFFMERPLGLINTIIFTLMTISFSSWVTRDILREKGCKNCTIKSKCKKAAKCPAIFVRHLINDGVARVSNKKDVEKATEAQDD